MQKLSADETDSSDDLILRIHMFASFTWWFACDCRPERGEEAPSISVHTGSRFFDEKTEAFLCCSINKT
jgi:hypothetical protein